MASYFQTETKTFVKNNVMGDINLGVDVLVEMVIFQQSCAQLCCVK